MRECDFCGDEATETLVTDLSTTFQVCGGCYEESLLEQEELDNE